MCWFHVYSFTCCDCPWSVEEIEELPVYQSNRKHKIVGFLATQKDLVDPASFLGVHMDERSSRRVILSAC